MSGTSRAFRSIPSDDSIPADDPKDETRVVQLSELSEAWESGEDVDIVGQLDSWGEDQAQIVPISQYWFDEHREAG